MPDPAGTDAVVVANWEQEAPRMAQALGSIRVPPTRLTPAQVEQFDRDGFQLPLPAVSEKEAAAVRSKIEAAEAASQQGGNGLFTNAHTLYDWFAELATCDAVLDVVQDLIGPDIMIWKSQLWIKESQSGSYVGWHQDARYWGLTPLECVNVWIALSDVREENGPMEFLAGSHTHPYPTEDTYEADNLLTRGQVIDWSPEAAPDPALVVRPHPFRTRLLA